MAASETLATPTLARRRPRPRLKGVGWTLLGVLLVTGVCVGILVAEGRTARNALNAAMDELPTTEAALRSGDPAAATAALDRLQPLARTARTHTDGPLWWVARHLPVVGDDVTAVAVSAQAVDDIATRVLPPLADVAGAEGAHALKVSGGTVDLTAFQSAAPGLADAAKVMDKVDASLAGVNQSHLVAQLSQPFDHLVAGTQELGSTVRTADLLANLGPTMLGAQGPRTYLVVAMNSAELRAGGGIPGGFALLTADQGHISLSAQAATGDIGPFNTPVADLDPGLVKLYTTAPALFVQDTTMTPDFPTAAALTATMWQQTHGNPIDGVLATDPVALSYLLEATGPVDVGSLTLDSGNVVEQLLSTSYAQMEPGAQTDAFFASVASAVTNGFLAGDFDPAAAATALDRAADEHRLLVWSAHSDEEESLANTVVSGAIDSAPRAAGSVGVFFNDATGGKMDYYLGSAVRLTNSLCVDGARRDSFEVALSSSAPANAATTLPWYVTGGGITGVPPGLMVTQAVLYPTRGGSITDVQLDNAPTTAAPATIAGRHAQALPVHLSPGQASMLRFTVVTPDPTGDDLDVWSTPTSTSPGLQTLPVADCD